MHKYSFDDIDKNLKSLLPMIKRLYVCREILRCFSNERRSFPRVVATIAAPERITTTWISIRERSWRNSEKSYEPCCRRSCAAITICWYPRRTMRRFRCHPRHRRPWTPTTSNCWPSTPHRWSRTAHTWLTPSTLFCRRSSTINHPRWVKSEFLVVLIVPPTVYFFAWKYLEISRDLLFDVDDKMTKSVILVSTKFEIWIICSHPFFNNTCHNVLDYVSGQII